MDRRDIPPPPFLVPEGWPSKRSRRNVENPYYLREIVEDLLGDMPGAFDPERSCPWCMSEGLDDGDSGSLGVGGTETSSERLAFPSVQPKHLRRRRQHRITRMGRRPPTSTTVTPRRRATATPNLFSSRVSSTTTVGPWRWRGTIP